MPTCLGSGPGVVMYFGAAHTELHGAINDRVANSRDAGKKAKQPCTNVTLRVGKLDYGERLELIAYSDDGPGPREWDPTEKDFKAIPTDRAMLRMARPGYSTSTYDPTLTGQWGVGCLSADMAFGDTVIYASHTPVHIFVTLVSIPYNVELQRQSDTDSKVIQLTCDKAGGGMWSSANADNAADIALFLQYTPFDSLSQLEDLLYGTKDPPVGQYRQPGPHALLKKRCGGLAVLIFGILLSPRRRLQVQIKTLSS